MHMQGDAKWLAVYATLVAAVIALSLGRNLGWFTLALRAGSRLNGRMLAAVLSAPLAFFHTTPTGRILNCFSKDQGSVDEQLPSVRCAAIFRFISVHLCCHFVGPRWQAKSAAQR